jgi:hypothetical protein
MRIESIGLGQRELECQRILRLALGERDEVGGISRILILPVPTTRDGRYVSDTDVSLDSIALGDMSGTAIIGYSIPEELSEAAVRCGARVCDARLDDSFEEENARLTALAALGYILLDAGASPEDITFGVAGWGRIGSKLCALLSFLGARVEVFTTSKDKRVELGRLGIGTRELTPPDLCGIDVLINTAPARLFDECDKGMKELSKIYDLASGNYLYGIPRVAKLPSLPSKYYSISSGRRYAEYALRTLGVLEDEIC